MTNKQIARFLKICDDYNLRFMHWYEDPFFKFETPADPDLQSFSFGFNMNDVFCYGADVEEIENDDDLGLLEKTCKEIADINNKEESIVIYPHYADVLYVARKHKILPTEKYLKDDQWQQKNKKFVSMLEEATEK